MASRDVILKIQGQVYAGWTTANIVKSMNQGASNYELSITERYPGQAAAWPIKNGYECVVEVNGYTLVTGYIEEIDTAYSTGGTFEADHRISIRGRDKTCDLVDCPHWKDYNGAKQNEWVGLPILYIIRSMCESTSLFGIPVNVVGSTSEELLSKKIDFKYNPGETVWEVVTRLCSRAAVWAYSVGDGKLTLSRAGSTTASDTIELGRNILSAEDRQDNTQRFSKYIVQGHNTDEEHNQLVGDRVVDHTQPIGHADDPVITRYRPYVIIPDGKMDSALGNNLAKWEALTRAGLSREIVYRVQGWLQSNGAPWTINTLVNVNDPMLGINGQLLITDINFDLSLDSGSTATITVVPKDAYLVQPYIPAKVSKSKDENPLIGEHNEA